MVRGKDTTGAWLGWKVVQLRSSKLALQALIAETDLRLALHSWAAYCHPETLSNLSKVRFAQEAQT